MNKTLFAAVSAVVILALSSAASAGAAIYKNNVLTASHITPPGTHVAIVPPKGAVLSSTFSGFELQNNCRIVIAERAGTSYKDIAGTLTAEGVEAMDLSFRDKSQVNLNGSQATIVEGSALSEPEIGALLLVLGNDRLTVTIYGFYNFGNKAEESTVKNAILSCVFNPAGVKSASGDYSISVSGTRFKFSDEIGSTRYFTVGGVQYGELTEALYTSTVADDVVPPEARNAYAESAIVKFLSRYQNLEIVSSRQVSFGKLPGIETIAEFDGSVRKNRTASGAVVTRTLKGKGYQALLFDENEGKIYVLGGVATADPDSYLSQFAKITSTFALTR